MKGNRSFLPCNNALLVPKTPLLATHDGIQSL